MAPQLSPPQLTLRAVCTGAALGGMLSLCNVYMGLKIGWSLNMSVTAALLSYGGYQLLGHARARRGKAHQDWGLLENNINQTAASAAASISSAGLVAPIPAWTLITGQSLSTGQLMVWTGSVALFGVLIAVGLRRQLIERDQLTFPYGVATAETVKEMYARGAEAMVRVKMLIGGVCLGSLSKCFIYWIKIKHIALPSQTLSKALGLTWHNLTLSLSTSPLFIAVGALIGLRSGLSMLLGGLVAWGVIAPMIIHQGWIMGDLVSGDLTSKVSLLDPQWSALHSEKMWFKQLVTWLLWPGVAMMVSASLSAFLFSVSAMRRKSSSSLDQQSQDRASSEDISNDESTLTLQDQTRIQASSLQIGHATSASGPTSDEVPRGTYLALLTVVILISVCLQSLFFGISLGLAIFGIMLTFVLAIVAARVSGETGLTPIGAMGKVTQLTFGLLAPGQVSANLMTANVTGGAASQCADLLHDLKTGLLIGASPRQQTYAQLAGVISGAFCGSFAYLILVGDHQHLMQLWDDPAWAMPAVVQWRAVAELFQGGIDQLPAGAISAMMWGAILGVVFTCLERFTPSKLRAWIPSPTAVGLAFVIPGYYSISMALGSCIAWLLSRFVTSWAQRFVIVLASGIIAGDSLTGVVIAIRELILTPG